MDDYRQYFNVARRNVSDKARCYLAGLVTKAPRKNMERMEEYVDVFDSIPAKFRSLTTTRLSIIFVSLTVLVFYYITFQLFKIDIFKLLFSAFGFLIVLAPTILLSIAKPHIAKNKIPAIANILGIWVGTISMIYFTFFARNTETIGLLGSLISVLLSAVIVCTGFLIHTTQSAKSV